jgi:hypothetical protein
MIVEPNAVEVTVEDGARPLALRAIGPDGRAVGVRAEPGTRHATRRDGGGFRAWEEIS